MSRAYFNRIGKRDLFTVNSRALWNIFVLGFFFGVFTFGLTIIILCNIN